MNIIQVNNWCRGRGGIEAVVEETTRLLKSRGMDVAVLGRDSRNLAIGLHGRAHAFLSGIYSFSAKDSMRDLIQSERPDIVHIHHIYPFISTSVIAECKRLNLPVVMTLHSYFMTCPCYFHLRKGKICEMCLGGKEYWCVLNNCRNNYLESLGYAIRNAMARKFNLFRKNITLFIALTKFAKTRLVNIGFPESQIVTLSNMISISENSDKRSLGEYIAYAGRISPEKGIDTLIAAAQYLPQTRVRLAGDCSNLPKYIKYKPDNADFVGFLNKEQLMAFYRNARFLVVPSKWFEMFPLVIIEAMSFGLPVIASKIGGLPELVEEGVTGLLFEPGNAEELAEKMKLLWENPDLCHRMGQAGREKAIREYSEDIYYKRLMAIYNRAIEINKEKNCRDEKS